MVTFVIGSAARALFTPESLGLRLVKEASKPAGHPHIDGDIAGAEETFGEVFVYLTERPNTNVDNPGFPTRDVYPTYVDYKVYVRG